MAVQSVNQAEVEAFANRVFADTSAMAVTIMAALGDELGLFKSLVAHGPCGSAELAIHAGINERYAREWLAAMTCAGYLRYDAYNQRFALPLEYVPTLADEGGPFFVGGIYQMLLAMVSPLEQLTTAFRQGGGLSQAAYPPSVWQGMERDSAIWVENSLVQQWLAAMPDLRTMLERGGWVADVGSGEGLALIKLAQVFPNSHYVGYDVFAPTVERANANAVGAGVAERVRFVQRDASEGLPEQYDLITTFDVIHDAANPVKLLRAIHQALQPDGWYLCMDVNCADSLEDNIGPRGALRYAYSILYCMTTSLASGGAGLGTMGLPEAKLRELCAAAGFSRVERVPLGDDANALYKAKS